MYTLIIIGMRPGTIRFRPKHGQMPLTGFHTELHRRQVNIKIYAMTAMSIINSKSQNQYKAHT